MAGVTAIETSTAGVTVSVVESWIAVPGSVAVIVVAPVEALVASRNRTFFASFLI